MRQWVFDITNNNGHRCIERVYAETLSQAKFKLSHIQCVEVYHNIC